MADDIESLLMEGEGTRLDYKEQQYPFIGATDPQKAKLLKDILAFANSFRSSDAYILVGVRDNPGDRAIVLGCDEHPDDASLQEFVNSKTNRPVEFSYKVFSVDGKRIGMFRIPQQARPTFLKQRFADVEKEVVYYRQGSSNQPANPTIVARMGAVDVGIKKEEPGLSCYFVNSVTKERLEDVVYLRSQRVVLNRRSLPDYGNDGPFVNPGHDPSYWRKLASYVQDRFMYRNVFLAVENHSGVTATDIVVEIRFQTPLTGKDYDEMPYMPDPNRFSMLENLVKPVFRNPHFTLVIEGDDIVLRCSIPKLQAGRKMYIDDPVCLGCYQAGMSNVSIKIWATELSSPAERIIVAHHKFASAKFDDDDILKLLDACVEWNDNSTPGFFDIDLTNWQREI